MFVKYTILNSELYAGSVISKCRLDTDGIIIIIIIISNFIHEILINIHKMTQQKEK